MKIYWELSHSSTPQSLHLNRRVLDPRISIDSQPQTLSDLLQQPCIWFATWLWLLFPFSHMFVIVNHNCHTSPIHWDALRCNYDAVSCEYIRSTLSYRYIYPASSMPKRGPISNLPAAGAHQYAMRTTFDCVSGRLIAVTRNSYSSEQCDL